MIKRKGSAVWSGGLKDGKGTVSTQSGVLNQSQYGFNTRFEDGAGTNPEELLAAAHAGCFTMALSAQLGEAGMTAQKLETTATVSLDKATAASRSRPSTSSWSATIPGASEQAFQEAARKAKEGCPVSKLFNADITLDAKLQS
jgi:osmotically inducible protein OsmC